MKKNNFFKTVLLCTASVVSFNLSGQCANAANIYTITTNGKKYEVVKQKTDWIGAAQCAVQRGGYLAEINSVTEQNAIFSILQSSAAGINLSNTTAQDGGGASYVWIGGRKNDVNQWLWDGNDDNNGIFFWSGGPPNMGGVPMGNAYVNWGNEPDNFQGMQDRLGLGLTNWPAGGPGNWNDLFIGDQLYYVIEYNSTLATDDLKSEKASVQLYPNAVKDFLSIKTMKNMTGIALTDASGRKVKSVSVNGTINEKLDCTSLSDGVYFIEIMYQDKTSTQHKIIKIQQ